MLINPYFTGFFKEYYTPALVPHCPPESLTNPYFTDFPPSKLFQRATFFPASIHLGVFKDGSQIKVREDEKIKMG